MKTKKKKTKELTKIEGLIDYSQTLEVQEETFKKVMFIYAMAIRELETKIGILKDEYKIFYHYELIDHIDTRIKEPKSIIEKMKKRDNSMYIKKRHFFNKRINLKIARS